MNENFFTSEKVFLNGLIESIKQVDRLYRVLRSIKLTAEYEVCAAGSVKQDRKSCLYRHNEHWLTGSLESQD